MKCKSLTLKGKKCKNDAIEGDSFCRLHSKRGVDRECIHLLCGKSVHINGLTIKIIPKDYFLFRSQNGNTEWGNWFTTREIAQIYLQSWHYTNCNKYVTRRDVQLVDVSDVDTIEQVLKSNLLSDEEKSVVINVTGYGLTEVPTTSYSLSTITPYTNKNPKTLAFIPVGYHSVGDFLAGVYINKRFAQIVCKLGYDGWYVGRGRVQDTSLPAGGTMLSEEVMLCNPQDVLERTMEAC